MFLRLSLYAKVPHELDHEWPKSGHKRAWKTTSRTRMTTNGHEWPRVTTKITQMKWSEKKNKLQKKGYQSLSHYLWFSDIFREYKKRPVT